MTVEVESPDSCTVYQQFNVEEQSVKLGGVAMDKANKVHPEDTAGRTSP